MKNKLIILMFTSFIPHLSYADDLAFPGFTGVLRTPNAEIESEGRVSYQYNNYNDLGLDKDNTFNHVFTVGISSNFEVGGRLTDWYDDDRERRFDDFLTGIRDLSGNFKYKLPKFNSAFPELAVGMTDISGHAVNFKTMYAVGTKSIGPIEFSVGYANAKNEDDIQKTASRTLIGGFANIKYDVTDNLSLMVDYTSRTSGVGFSYGENIYNTSISFQTLAVKQDGNWDKTFGLTLSFPLGFNKGTNGDKKRKKLVLKPEGRNLQKFTRVLEELGFSGVRVGKKDGSDVVFYENHIYNHNFIDPLTVVLTNAYRYLGDRSLTAVALKKGIPVLSVKTDLNKFAKYIQSKGGNGFNDFKNNTQAAFVEPGFEKKVHWLTKAQSKRPVDIVVRPEINTAVGTEYGLFDYSLGATINLTVPVTKSVDAVVSGTIPFVETDNYDDDGVYEDNRLAKKINQVAVQKFSKPKRDLALLTGLGHSSIGDDNYVVGEAVALWQPKGNAQIGARLTHMAASDKGVEDETIALATYRYNWEQRKINAAVTYGQYYLKDRGVTASLSRFFGDTEFTTYLKIIDDEDVTGGLQVNLPLTPRKDYKAGGVVLRGTQHLNYANQITIKDPQSPTKNTLRYDVLLAPGLENSLGGDIYDRLRMNPRYLMNNLDQLKRSARDLLY